MLLRIILGSIAFVAVIIILLVIMVRVTIWRVIVPTQYICAVFDEVFGMYLSEGIFSREQTENITIGTIKIDFSNLEEACDEVEKYVNLTLKGYDKHIEIHDRFTWKV